MTKDNEHYHCSLLKLRGDLMVMYCKFKNSLIIHKEKTKEITAMSVVLYLIKNHVNFSFDFLDLDNVYF